MERDVPLEQQIIWYILFGSFISRSFTQESRNVEILGFKGAWLKFFPIFSFPLLLFTGSHSAAMEGPLHDIARHTRALEACGDDRDPERII